MSDTLRATAASVPHLPMALRLAGETPLLIVWGGLGFSRRPIRELKELYTAYKDELSPFIHRCDAVLHPLLVDDAAGQNTPGGLMQWMTAEGKRSPTLSPVMTMVATSLLQMARYVLLCKILGKTPGEMARSASAFTGHSVGLLCAVVMAASDSWDSLYDRIEPLVAGYYHGIRCANDVWDSKNLVPAAAAAECMRLGEGSPSPMLSIVGLEESRLTQEMDRVNETLPADRKLHIALINEGGSYVAAGGPEGLVALCGRVRAPSQGLGPRKTDVSLQFIPASVPFHSPHLIPCTPAIARKTERFTILRRDILVPVWGVDSFLDAQKTEPNDNIAPLLGNLLFPRRVDWPATMASMTGKWQVLDLGPGGTTGIGSFINRMKSDPKTKVYTVLPQDLARRASHPLLCAVSQDPNLQTYEHAVLGERCVAPSEQPMRRLPSSKFTDLLGLPRVLVAGMTPTTCDVDYVAAVMNAGYYVEFATGGYHDAKSLESAITSLSGKIPKGRLITLNIIYANPRGLAWMIPQIAALVRQGCPIGGITIGAGVPDAAVVAEWVNLLELSYIGFKPSSTTTIRQVLDIARAHPTLPVMLQWTGGRAGGHHSREDFHQPILETYQAIREVSNVILIGGSGFGDAESSWPYISGDWSQIFGRPLMPFDATLIGTCMMTTLEAKTSPEAKRAMVEAAGVHDEEWSGTLKGGAGGAISIISHLGESMHVLATRGMRLWAEFDKTLFNLPKDKMVAALETRRDSIVARLNSDHQKVWFGFDYDSMSPVDLEDMTYISVLRRLLDLVHPLRTENWTHPSYQGIVDDWMTRILERFADSSEHLQNDADPRQQLRIIASRCPEAALRFLSLEDTHFFIDLCGQRGRKPVPFIPVLDADFPVWFKKDPLWQSENLGDTFHGDVERLCILAGPVALQHCVEADVPVARFLDGIARGYADKERSLGVANPPSPLYEVNELVHLLGPTHVSVEPNFLRLGQYAPGDVDNDLWLQLLGTKLGAWGRDLFGTRKLHGEGQTYDNPMRRIFAAQPGAVVELSGATDDGYTAAAMYVEGSKGCGGLVDAKVSITGTTITAVIPNPYTAYGQTADFELKFEHVVSCPYAPVVEEQKQRVDRVLNHIGDVFFGSAGLPGAAIPPGTTQLVVDVASDKFSLWMSAVDGQGLDNVLSCHVGKEGEVPMEYCTILVMKLLWQLLLERGWDTAKLLHRRTTVDVKKGQMPLMMGDRLVVTWGFDCLHNSNSGMDSKFHMDFFRDGVVAIGIHYEFSILDERVPEAECFGSLVTNSWSWDLGSPVDRQVLLSKPWFQLTGAPDALQPGARLVFDLDREATGRTPGTVWIQDGYGQKTLCGRVDAEAAIVNGTNLAVGFLNRRGTRLSIATPEGKLLKSRAGKPLKIVVPRNSVEYCRATRDFNPNHTNAAFARYSGWREPIVQGNQTAALLLRLIRQEIPGASVATMRRYDIDFCSVVYQGDVLAVSLRRSGMQDGNSLLTFNVQREESDEIVLSGQIELAPPVTAYLFTGQGSQFAGMGLDLIDQSKAVRQVWTEAEEYFRQNWGFSLIDIVQRNPKTLTVNFSSRKGIRVRQTYLEVQEMFKASHPLDPRELFPGLHAKSRTYQFQHEEGMLSMTQFAQPAILVLERAAFEHLRHQGRVPDGSYFAGHSLGEFAALGCMTRAMTLAASLRTVFVRGTLMQMAVPRDARGRSGYAMAAVDPSRVRPDFGEPQLQALVGRVAAHTGLLLEMVNLNVRGRQYVCAGDRRALCLLRAVTDALHNDATVAPTDALVARLAPECVAGAAADAVLTNGRALIPLPGIDVPFHSSLMAAMGELFRQTLLGSVDRSLIRAADLTGRWIPNVTGRLFSTDKAYLDSVVQLTGSPRLTELAVGLAA